jgi:CRISPR-associated endoribonuclease Cas6
MIVDQIYLCNVSRLQSEGGCQAIRLYVAADSGNEPRFHLPWNYHRSVQSFVYDALDRYEPELASDLHQSPHAPPFVFSEFVQTGPYQTDDDGLTCERGYWVFGSDKSTILDAVANHARHSELSVGHTQVPVEGEELESVRGTQRARYRSLSPIYVSQTLDERREDLTPNDGMWYARLRDNVRDRMKARWGETPDNLVIEDVHWWKSSRLRVGEGGWATGVRLEATLRMDEQTSKFIQKCGLGERTGCGFGFIMPISQIPEEWR